VLHIKKFSLRLSPSHLKRQQIILWLKPKPEDSMNPEQIRKVVTLNVAFWAVAIAFPYLARLLPTASGNPPKFYEVLLPLIQIMLALAATFMVKSALCRASGSAG
jgi:hypothetical protein